VIDQSQLIRKRVCREMNMELSGQKSQNGELYENFVNTAREKKLFEFKLADRTFVSEEYEMDGLKLWRVFADRNDIVPFKIFLTFDDLLTEDMFEGSTFSERFSEFTINYDCAPMPKNDKPQKEHEKPEEN